MIPFCPLSGITATELHYFACRDSFCCKSLRTHARTHTHTHTHTHTNLCKLYLSLIGRHTAKEGGPKSWSISIPIQADKSACSLTWRCTQHQTRRGGGKGGTPGEVHGTRVKHGGGWVQTWKGKFRHSPHGDAHRSAHRPRSVRKSAQPRENCARSQDTASLLLLPTAGGGLRLSPPPPGLSHPVLLSCCRSDPDPRVTHEARGRSQDGSVQEAVEGEEADRCGVHPAVPASPTAHPPHQREYKLNWMLFRNHM